MHPLLAFRAFFAVLFRHDTAMRIRDCLNNSPPIPTPSDQNVLNGKDPELAIPAKPSPFQKSRSVQRSDALTLLSTLQREARLLDLICESLDQYNDAQIGAAARDVLRDSRKTLDRVFGLKPLVDASEGSTVPIPSEASPVRWRIIGKDSAKEGVLSHAGWQATKLDMPQWSGSANDEMVIAATEVES